MHKKFIIREVLILSGMILLGAVSFVFGFHFRTLYGNSSVGDMLGAMGGVGLLLAMLGYPVYVIARVIIGIIKKPWASSLTGIKVVGYTQSILGALGTMLALFILIGSLIAGFFAEGEQQMGFLGIMALPLFIPFPIILIPGLGVLMLRPWARKMQVIMSSIVLALTTLMSLAVFSRRDWAAFLWLLGLMALCGFLIYYFSHPKVKRQFL